jgi:chromosome segregation ATPase
LQKLLNNNDNLKNQIQSAEQCNANLTKDLTVANRAVATHQAEIDKLNLATEQSTNKITSLTSELATSTQLVNDLAPRKNELEIELTAIKKDLEKIKEPFQW